MRDALHIAELLRLGAPGLELASYVMHGAHNKFEAMNRALGRNRTFSFFMCSLFRDFLGLPQGGHLGLLGPMGEKEAAGQYRTLFTAFQIRSPHIFLRLPSQRPYVGPQVQQYPGGLDAEWEKRLTRWTLGVQ